MKAGPQKVSLTRLINVQVNHENRIFITIIELNLGFTALVNGCFPQVKARDEHRVVARLERVALLADYVAEFRCFVVLVPTRRACQRELRPDLHHSSRKLDLLLGPALPFSKREKFGEERETKSVNKIVAVVAAAKFGADIRRATMKFCVMKHLRSRVELVQEHFLQFAVVLHTIDNAVEKLIGH